MGTIVEITSADRHLSYLPLAHIFERVFSTITLYRGTKVYFYGGDIFKLAADIADAKPTIFLSVPRLYNRFYEGINK